AGLSPQAADGVVGDAVPVAVELGGAAVEEDEPGEVDRTGRGEERRRGQRVAEGGGRADVPPAGSDERGDTGHGVEEPLHAGPDLVAGGGAAAAAWPCVRHVHEVDQVGAFDVVELQRPGERVEYVVGDAADAATLDARVVLDRD